MGLKEINLISDTSLLIQKQEKTKGKSHLTVACATVTTDRKTEI